MLNYGEANRKQFFNTNYLMIVPFHLKKALSKMSLSKSDELSTGLEV